MSNPIDLTVQVKSDTSDAASGFDKVARAATDMANAVDKAGNDAKAGAAKMDTIGESADNLDSKSAQATGSLGALSSGFELVGADKYAGALQSAAMATDFMAGVGEGLNLIMELQSVQFVVAKVQSAAYAVQTKATAAAQWALNAAMEANPIGLIIIAVVALVAGLVLLYKKSETFRQIVQTVGEVGKRAFAVVVEAAGDVIGKIREVYDFVRDKLIPKISDIIGTARDMAGKVVGFYADIWNKIGDVVAKIGDLVAKVKDVPENVREKITALIGLFGDVITKVGDMITKVGDFVGSVTGIPAKIRDAIGKVVGLFDDILQKIIDIADKLTGGLVGKVVGAVTRSAPAPAMARSVSGAAMFGGVGARAIGAGAVTSGGALVPVVNITINGAIDTVGTAAQIRQVLTRAGLITGRVTP